MLVRRRVALPSRRVGEGRERGENTRFPFETRWPRKTHPCRGHRSRERAKARPALSGGECLVDFLEGLGLLRFKAEPPAHGALEVISGTVGSLTASHVLRRLHEAGFEVVRRET